MPKIVSSEELSRAVIVSEGPARVARKPSAKVQLEDVLAQVSQAIKHLVDLHMATRRMIDRRQAPSTEALAGVLEQLAGIQQQVATTLTSLAEERIAAPPVQNITVVHPRDDRAIDYEIIRDGFGNITRVKRTIA